jgi:glycerol-3-phosphate dehydrogenase
MPDPTHDNTPPLERDPDRLASTDFDLVVVGGGIYGVWAALDAAQRGLKVAMLEQNDFGSGASANSQRVVHGGLRYLQHADFKRMRESIRERSNLLRLAGHLVEPMPFIVPTYGLGMRGRLALFTAMKLNDLISADRNHGLADSRQLPNGGLISSNTCLEQVPGIDPKGLTGGAVIYDAQVNNSERLALAVVRSAVDAGAQVANHMRATGLLRTDNRVAGVTAEDRLTGKTYEVNARVTLGCAGPWTGRTASIPPSDISAANHKYPILRAVALVTRDLFNGMGLAVPSRKAHKDEKELLSKGFRNLFVTSWCGLSLIGTFYTDYDGEPDALSVSPDEVSGFINEFNQTYPAAGLTYDDVRFTFMGLQPKAHGNTGGEPVASKRYLLIDHSKADGTDGLITVLGVKWTTARGVAEEAVSLASDKLNTGSPPCRTAQTLIHGAPDGDPAKRLADVRQKRPDWADESLMAHLFATYGTAYAPVLDLAESDPHLREPLSDNHPAIQAQIVYAARNEMAQTLLDVLFHRTDIGFRGYPGGACIDRCARLLAEALGWDEKRVRREIASVHEAYHRRGLATSMPR